MAHRRQWSRPLLTLLAVMFAAATLLYNVLWMAAMRARPGPPLVELGYNGTYLATEHAQRIDQVYANSPAERAGMRPGDRIVAVNGLPLQNEDTTDTVWRRAQPGETVQLTVTRRGQASPVILAAVFRLRLSRPDFAQTVGNWYPVPFVVVGLTVLFLRLEDPKVWLLALMFASFTSTPGFPDTIAQIAPALRPFTRTYQALFLSLLGTLFYWFFAVFPTPSPLDRRLPWLKWASLWVGLSFGLSGLPAGKMQLPPPLFSLLGENVSDQVALWFIFTFLTFGLVSLGANFFRTSDAEARRKMRVIFWGTGVGLVPNLVDVAARNTVGFESPPWLRALLMLDSFLIPLSFAYAVVKHRVLEIPVLLKRSARYVLVQRGFIVVLSLLSIGLTLLFALSFPRYLQAATDAAQPSGIALGAAFGTLLLWGGSQIHKRVSGRIDRAFFRSAYDARLILEDLAQRTRAATGREELAHLLQHHLEEALRPSSLVIYLEQGGGRLAAAAGAVPRELETIAASLPVLAELAERSGPWDVPPESKIPLAALRPEILVPMPGRGGGLVGLLALGPRLSEEPYSGEDKRLLASVASQAGTAWENIRLAEEIAARLESERRVAREMEIAKEVQARLLPQAPSHLKTLDCAAQCIQARSVGGDCYDFLDLGPDRLGFALADVSGKGVHAALLMANLQAHLRSQSGIAPADPVRLLQQVNRLLWKSTATEHYATLFFGIYDDSTRRLVYVNCGHNPPVWLRANGTVERLPATALVIGAFEPWDCSAVQVQLAPGDLLAVFSDGVTEAVRGEDEFGEARLIDALRAHSQLPVHELVDTILASVQQFSAGAQYDDLTLLIARVRA